MKKIALMTWHHVENYGTAFQAYALKTVLESLGCEVGLINYMRNYQSPLRQKRVRDMMVKKQKHKTEKRFYDAAMKKSFYSFFETRFTYTDKCEYNQDFQNLNPLYDGFICGSDQIWGPEWFDSRFFLDFVNNPERMISYAPSFGVASIDEEDMERSMSTLLKRFSHISVREETGCEIVKKITERTDAEHVLDPVLLLDSSKWDEIAESESPCQKRYAFIFFLKNNEKYFEHALQQAKRMNLKPVIMHCTQSEDNPYANTEGVSPERLLSYIKYSDFVFTDSFHVTVLSILYAVQFLTYNKTIGSGENDKNGRIKNLLEILQINNHIYSDNIRMLDYIDFDSVHNKLVFLRKQSLAYLTCAIDGLPRERDKASSYCENVADGCLCKGKYTREFENQKGKLFWDNMERWNFCLEDKCYGCEKLDVKYNARKPLFYYRLQEDISDGKKKVFFNYYFLFSLVLFIKKSLLGRLQKN